MLSTAQRARALSVAVAALVFVACTEAPTAARIPAAARSSEIIPITPPVAPSDLFGDVTSFRPNNQGAWVHLTWTDNSDNEHGFRVEGVGSKGALATADWPNADGVGTTVTQTLGWSPDTWTITVRSYVLAADSATRVYSDPSNSIVLKTCAKANDPKCR